MRNFRVSGKTLDRSIVLVQNAERGFSLGWLTWGKNSEIKQIACSRLQADGKYSGFMDGLPYQKHNIAWGNYTNVNMSKCIPVRSIQRMVVFMRNSGGIAGIKKKGSDV